MSEKGRNTYAGSVDLGKRIRLWMAKLDLNQKQLALRSGLDSSTVSKIIRGLQEPGYSKVQQIIVGLGVSEAEFFSLDEAGHGQGGAEGVVKEDVEQYRSRVIGARGLTLEDLDEDTLRLIVRIVRASIEGRPPDESD